MGNMTLPSNRQRTLQPQKKHGITHPMRNLWRLTAILMLLVFGLSTAAEAFAVDSTYEVCDSDELAANAPVEFQGDVVKALDDAHATNSSSPCHDPCHYGSGHFGHCSCVLFESKTYTHAIDLSSAKALFLELMAEDPFLEGLKRPPRHI